MNKDDHEIYEAYDVRDESLGAIAKGALGAVRTNAGKASSAIQTGAKTVAAKARTTAKKIPGADKMYKTSQNDQYKDTAFGNTMKALNSAGKGDFSGAAKGLGNAFGAYQDYGKKKAAKAAADAKAARTGTPNDSSSPVQPTAPSDDKSTTVKSPSEKRAERKDPKSTNKPSTPKNEGTKGTKSDRKKADVDGDGEIEDWEKAKANAIRKSQGKKHLCAKVVNHESFGPGSCIHAQHAIPDVEGNIEWYMVEFKHGTEKIQTNDVEVVIALEHMHN